MKNITKITLSSIIMITAALAPACNKAHIRPGADRPTAVSTAADRSSIEVTIYNNDMGLVKEQRNVNIVAGTGELRFVDVAAKINPVTVNIQPLSGDRDFFVLEQNYEYDLISHAKLMEKYVGQKIKFIAKNEYHDRVDTVFATLVSASAAGGEVYSINDSIYLGYLGIKILPELPENLISRPTLSWVYGNSGKGGRACDLEVSYLTAGMGWNADYILNIADKGAVGGLMGWVTVTNESGAEYRGAKLALVAGKVNTLPVSRKVVSPLYIIDELEDMGYSEQAAGGFVESEVFEYHIYHLERKTDILDKQTKQISLLEAQGVSIIKEYTTGGSIHNPYSHQGYLDDPQGRPVRRPVAAYLTFKNTKENGLGAPLPAGTVRIYTSDDRGAEQFIGEDRIGHTPKDEEVRVRVGEAFDIVAERTRVSFKEVTSREREVEWKIALRNHKAEGVTVAVTESAWQIEQGQGQWEIIEASHGHIRVDANSFRFDVAVGAGEEVVVTYRARVVGD